MKAHDNHYLNKIISEQRFKKLRDKARAIDDDLKRLQMPMDDGDLDPEIQE